MTDTTLCKPGIVSRATLPSGVRETAMGLLYWLAFLLVLEPDNVMKAPDLLWSQELIRIVGASLLGASITPPLIALVRHYPVEGRGWIRRMAIEGVCSVLFAAALIALSCLLADWFLASEQRPLGFALVQELEGNWTLLTFAIGGMLAIIHMVHFRDRNNALAMGQEATPRSGYVTRIRAKSRGHVALIDVADIEWIETQGNYLALHTATAVHLIRESLAEFERKLDPARFARVHRRTVVAMDSISEVQCLGSGDAVLKLKDGTELRVSRSYRDRTRTFAR